MDADYGKGKTAKGVALEKLVIEIFKQVRFVKGSIRIKGKTNQFDCIVLTDIKYEISKCP